MNIIDIIEKMSTQKDCIELLEKVKSTQISLQCREAELEELMTLIKAHHPYEEPAIEVIELRTPSYD